MPPFSRMAASAKEAPAQDGSSAPMRGAARREDVVGEVGIVGRAKQRRDLHAEGGGRDRQQLEIAEMAGEQDVRLLFGRRCRTK